MTQTPSDWDEGALNSGTPTGIRLRAPYLETQQAIGKLTQGSNAPLWSGLTGAPFVNVSPVGTAQGYPKNNGANYGPDTPGTTTCGIQEAITAGNPIYLLSGTFAITSEIILPANQRTVILGSGWSNDLVGQGNWVPPVGTVIQQNTAGLSIIHCTTRILGFVLRDTALQFTQSVNNHGVFFDPETMLSSISAPTGSQLNISYGVDMKNVMVYGVDANHYAYRLANVLQGTLDELQAVTDGGYIEFLSYNKTGSVSLYDFGNFAWIGYNYCFKPTAGVTPTVPILYYHVADNASLGQQLNFIKLDGYLQFSLQPSTTYSNPLLSVDAAAYACSISRLDIEDLTAANVNLTLDINSPSFWIEADDDWPSLCTFSQKPPVIPKFVQDALVTEAAYPITTALQVWSYTPPQDEIIIVDFSSRVDSYTSGTLTVQLTYTDAGGTLRTVDLPSQSALGLVTGSSGIIHVKANQPITIATTGTFVARTEVTFCVRRYA